MPCGPSENAPSVRKKLVVGPRACSVSAPPLPFITSTLSLPGIVSALRVSTHRSPSLLGQDMVAAYAAPLATSDAAFDASRKTAHLLISILRFRGAGEQRSRSLSYVTSAAYWCEVTSGSPKCSIF